MSNLLLSKIFLKPVDRNIEGVIKADGETDLKSGVEEYVLAAEKNLDNKLAVRLLKALFLVK